MRRIATIVLIIIASLLLWSGWKASSEIQESQPPVMQLDESTNTEGFSRVFEPQSFLFPLDNGPHLDYQTEWWYFTGNLETDQGRHFGYQLTFFRRGLSPVTQVRQSSLATNQVYFAHFAITDVSGDSHKEVERFSRGTSGLAGASGDPYQLWLEDWKVISLNDAGSHLRLTAMDGAMGLDLELRTDKPIILHGMDGLSPKSSEEGNASYYMSYTHLETSGSIELNGNELLVQGESWFDHEWSTTVLGKNAVGWDWFGLQLSDGREVMLFLIRNSDGSFDEVSGGTLVEPEGRATSFSLSDFEVETLNRWKSPETGADYPASWRLIIPLFELDLTIEPWLNDQEMRLSLVYWEGAVRVTGTSEGYSIMGNGYVELTGYAHSFQGVF